MKSPVIFKAKYVNRGFTLVELMLSVSLFVLVATIVFPVTISFYQTQILNDVQGSLVSALRESQMLAIVNKNDTSYGVYLQNDSYTIFSGDSYSERIESEDEIVSIISNVTISGPSEIVFSKITGLSNIDEIISLSAGQKTREIEITSFGNIN